MSTKKQGTRSSMMDWRNISEDVMLELRAKGWRVKLGKNYYFRSDEVGGNVCVDQSKSE